MAVVEIGSFMGGFVWMDDSEPVEPAHEWIHVALHFI